MKNTVKDVLDYVREEDVKFIRLAFLDVDGNLKNASVMPGELERAFSSGVSIDGSAIKGFAAADCSDLFLFPDPDTLTVLPWRPSHGRVIRLFCDVKNSRGESVPSDSRGVLKRAVEAAKNAGITCNFAAEFEFYLFKTDENGNPTKEPSDAAGYMDVAPLDKGENVRREICLTIEEMGLTPECSHHEEGPGQNEIDFKYSDALSSADHAVIFKNATQIVAYKNGFNASFEPKPLLDSSGSGMHVNVSVEKVGGERIFEPFIAGVMSRIKEITYFLNPTENSYERLGLNKAPKQIFCDKENRNALVRIPAGKTGERFELRSPDGMANVYLAYALIIFAGLEGVEKGLDIAAVSGGTLPESLNEAKKLALNSEFVKSHIGEAFLK